MSEFEMIMINVDKRIEQLESTTRSLKEFKTDYLLADTDEERKQLAKEFFGGDI